MNTLAGIFLALLGIVIFRNYVNGTLGQWFKAKFLNIKS